MRVTEIEGGIATKVHWKEREEERIRRKEKEEKEKEEKEAGEPPSAVRVLIDDSAQCRVGIDIRLRSALDIRLNLPSESRCVHTYNEKKYIQSWMRTKRNSYFETDIYIFFEYRKQVNRRTIERE